MNQSLSRPARPDAALRMAASTGAPAARAALVLCALAATALYAVRVEADSPAGRGLLRIHEARGLWWEYLRVEEAAAVAGGARLEYSWDVYGSPDGYHGCGAPLAGFPSDVGTLARFNVVLIENCRAAALAQNAQQPLKAWVEASGALLVTGGPFAFGAGGYKGAALGELLPAAVSDKPDFVKASGDTVLAPTPQGKTALGPAVPWGQRPRVFYLHSGLAPRDGAEVLATAGARRFSCDGVSGRAGSRCSQELSVASRPRANCRSGTGTAGPWSPARF